MICWLSETDFFGEQPARKAVCVLQYTQELGTLHPIVPLPVKAAWLCRASQAWKTSLKDKLPTLCEHLES